MQYTLIIAVRASMVDDPLLHALACVLGPARVAEMGALDGEPADAIEVIFYLHDQYDGPELLRAVEKHQVWLAGRPLQLILPGGGDAIAWEHDVMLQLFRFVPRLAFRSLPADPDQALQWILDMGLPGRRKAMRSRRLDPGQLRSYVEDFLSAHNTCALATNYRGLVSCRPIEYHYAAGHIYLVSEGGQKFAGLLGDKQAAISIFEPYQGFDRLAGMQLAGLAAVPMPGSGEYDACLLACGLQPARLADLPVTMHAIDIRLIQAAYLWSGFAKLGVDVRQDYTWDTQGVSQ